MVDDLVLREGLRATQLVMRGIARELGIAEPPDGR